MDCHSGLRADVISPSIYLSIYIYMFKSQTEGGGKELAETVRVMDMDLTHRGKV